MRYFENESAVLYVFPEQKLSVTRWKGFASSALLREVLDHARNMLAEHEIHYSLNDNRNLKVIRPADQEYINNEWLPEVLKRATIKKSATVESEDVFGKISTDKIMRAADQYITFDIAFFSSLEEATQWLGVKIPLEQIAA